MASTIFTYPVQRQRFPSSACAISSRDGSGFFSSRASALKHDAGRAVAALRRAGGDEAIGPHAPLLVGQPLVRHDVLSLYARRLLRTRDDRLSVDDHRARAARALGCAAVLDGAEPELLAEHLEQALAFPRIRQVARSPLRVNSTSPTPRAQHEASSAILSTTPLNASTQ